MRKNYLGKIKGERIIVEPEQGPCYDLDIRLSQPLANHSASFSWGYNGSGPAQTALAILYDYTGNSQLALEHYQQFKFDKIGVLPSNGFCITSEEIEQWLAKNT